MTAENFRRIYCVSDIHGDVHGLAEVLAAFFEDGYEPELDLLVQTGDIIDGYAYSRACVHLLRQFQSNHKDNIVILKGNHEAMAINAVGKHEAQSDFRVWWQQGGEATWQSYNPHRDYKPWLISTQIAMAWPKPEPFIPDGILASDIAWFKTLPLTYETDDYIFVHAGLRPLLPIEAQKERDMLWIREDFFNSSYDWGKVVVYGHTARPEPLIERDKIGLDTRWRGAGCVTGADLTVPKDIKLYHSERD